jgi:hypothetical protein
MSTAIEPTSKRSSGAIVWKLMCDCGNIYEGNPSRNIARAKAGFPTSCGCVASGRGKKKPLGYASCTSLIAKYRAAANRRNLAWDLTREEAEELFKSNCHYCGAEPSQVRHPPGNNGPYIYNGIDRQDNSLDYVPGNVVPCCGLCNQMKTDLNVNDFLTHIKRIAAIN